jgi:hypothetical protein
VRILARRCGKSKRRNRKGATGKAALRWSGASGSKNPQNVNQITSYLASASQCDIRRRTGETMATWSLWRIVPDTLLVLLALVLSTGFAGGQALLERPALADRAASQGQAVVCPETCASRSGPLAGTQPAGHEPAPGRVSSTINA